MQNWKKIVIAGCLTITAGVAVYYILESQRIKKINATIVTPETAKNYIRMMSQ